MRQRLRQELELGDSRREVVRVRLLARAEADLARESRLVQQILQLLGLAITRATVSLVQRFGSSPRRDQRKGA